MSLSEAIREGALRRPQGFGLAFVRQPAGVVESCALGAAYEALTNEISFDDGEVAALLRERFPVLTTRSALPCECQRQGTVLVESIITHLNDGQHEWTRERIADWVASVEDAA